MGMCGRKVTYRDQDGTPGLGGRVIVGELKSALKRDSRQSSNESSTLHMYLGLSY
ncbi:hypothetical protein RSAG8_08320, partial [Rhizoctonia solani AG-8 WAC10335]